MSRSMVSMNLSTSTGSSRWCQNHRYHNHMVGCTSIRLAVANVVPERASRVSTHSHTQMCLSENWVCQIPIVLKIMLTYVSSWSPYQNYYLRYAPVFCKSGRTSMFKSVSKCVTHLNHHPNVSQWNIQNTMIRMFFHSTVIFVILKHTTKHAF